MFRGAFRQYRRYRQKGGRKGRKGGVFKPPPIPNGAISTSVCLALALRYFAGGSPYDLMLKYGVSHSSLFDSVWIVVEAIKNECEFDIKYTSSHEEQRQIAHEFDNCVGAIDGILSGCTSRVKKNANALKWIRRSICVDVSTNLV